MKVKTNRINRTFHPSSFILHPSSSRGFTLLELLIVLLIIGLMSAVVVPRVGGNVDNLRLKTDVKKVAAALRYARSKAVSENRMAQAIFYTEEAKLVVLLEMKDAAGCFSQEIESTNETPEMLLSYGLQQGNIIQDDGNAKLDKKEIEIYFYASGGSSGGDLSLRNQKKKYRLNIDVFTGAVRVETDAL